MKRLIGLALVGILLPGVVFADGVIPGPNATTTLELGGSLVSTGNPLPIVLEGGSASVGTVGLNAGSNSVGTVGLNAGTNLVGKAGIDQTTPGSTNGVTQVPSAATAAGTAPIVTAALAANLVVKASAGNLYSFDVAADSTLSGAAWWLMVYNATSAPVDGSVTPSKCFALASGTTGIHLEFPTPVKFSTGIVLGVSTTGCFTKTASTHAFMSAEAQ